MVSAHAYNRYLARMMDIELHMMRHAIDLSESMQDMGELKVLEYIVWKGYGHIEQVCGFLSVSGVSGRPVSVDVPAATGGDRNCTHLAACAGELETFALFLGSVIRDSTIGPDLSGHAVRLIESIRDDAAKITRALEGEDDARGEIIGEMMFMACQELLN
ncbi:hypothetical protein INT08_09950 [Prosthecochloris sp. N3]|uniref:Ferritin/DPS protein domain-containing protein n=1 Tax=Prosthecochloris ethylica TaxID=2743976 RepID=A0ABR9XU27_9CHLB|nr:hypothetical protein [Prosthecochloris ethylica]MBF0587289.1 hypothetical protein [Prosthecochloris ethylica]MBF0637489.1 hypothetical protein [Prosthecochloris ethylica]NUK48097.1 hypothetical protein [Prosthecochloris ethylica]